MDWIKSFDRLPEDGQKVIYFFEHVGVHRGVYHDWHHFSSVKGSLQHDVTHWMPDEGQALPERPLGFDE